MIEYTKLNGCRAEYTILILKSKLRFVTWVFATVTPRIPKSAIPN